MCGSFIFPRLKPVYSTTIWVDNMAAIEVTKNESFNSKLKHVSVTLSLIKDNVKLGIVIADHVDGVDNRADVMTKPVTPSLYSL